MKNPVYLLGGMVGAVVGYIAGVLAFDRLGSNPHDPIASGLLAMLVFGPIGAIAGIVLGTKLVMRLCRRVGSGSVAGNSLKSLGVVVALVAGIGTIYYVYAVSVATPWLNPNAANPVLQFEIRLPAGAPLPVQPITVELQTDINTMPGVVVRDRFRQDDTQPVIVGEVDLAFRTAHRQLEVKVGNQPARLFRIGLDAKAPHAADLGPWQPQPDGSAIRYRARWPGRA